MFIVGDVRQRIYDNHVSLAKVGINVRGRQPEVHAGVGIASLVNLLDIQLVVIGGGLSATGELLLHPARLSFKEFIFSSAHRKLPEIITASLGAEAGMVGAAILALETAGAGAAQNADSMPAENLAQSP
jgi:hypothetical protein